MSSEITLDEDVADSDRLRPILWHFAKTVARPILGSPASSHRNKQAGQKRCASVHATGIDTMLQARNQLRVGRDSRRAKGLGSNLHEHRRQDIILLAVAQKHRRRWASGK